MARDIILVLEGGCMLGAFGAGVLTTLEQAGLYRRIHSVYAVSSGAHSGAYFLARNTQLGARLYYEDCTKGLLDMGRWRQYTYDILRNASEKTSLLDMERLYALCQEKRRPRIERLKRTRIRFYVQVIDVDTGEVLFVDGKDERAVMASCSAAPLYTKPITVGTRRFIDGLRISREVLRRIVREHRDKTIIYVLNDSPTRRSWISRAYERLYQLAHSALLYLVFGRKVAIANWRTEGLERRKAARLKNVILVANRRHVSKFCTERDKILGLYRHGILRGLGVLRTLKRSGPSLDRRQAL